MVFQGNPAVYNAAWITLRVSFGATLIASLIGLPLGYFLASTSFPGKGFCTIVLQTLLGFPTVVIGLLVYGFLSRRGPFGFADLLFTPSGIVIGLVVLAFPIVTMFTMTAVSGIDPRAREMALTLGASPRRAAWTLFFGSTFRTRLCPARIIRASRFRGRHRDHAGGEYRRLHPNPDHGDCPGKHERRIWIWDRPGFGSLGPGILHRSSLSVCPKTLSP